MNTELLTNVIKPRPAPAVRFVQSARFERESLQEQLVERAAKQVRQIYLQGIRRMKYDEKQPEPYFEACADTFITALEVERVMPDDTTAAIASAIFERAGWGQGNLRPTTLEAQVQMQMVAIEAAEQARQFFAKQTALI